MDDPRQVRTRVQMVKRSWKEQKCEMTGQQCGAVQNDARKVCVENEDENLSFKGERFNILAE